MQISKISKNNIKNDDKLKPNYIDEMQTSKISKNSSQNIKNEDEYLDMLDNMLDS